VTSTRKATVESRRQQRREEHQRVSRDQLLDAAEEVFGNKGYHQTTLKEVAELAEFSVGSVYSFFENKDDLFQQIFLRRGEQFLPGMRAVLSSAAPADQVLGELVAFEVGFYRDNPHFARLYLRSWSTSRPSEQVSNPTVMNRYAEAINMQAELFARGQAAGTFCDGDPGALSRLFSGLVASFQALDPLVMSDDPTNPDELERMSLDEFQRLVARTFVR